VAIGRGDVDDAARPLGDHHPSFVLHAQQHAQNIGFERRRIAFRSLLGHGAGRSFRAGVVDGDVDAAESRHGSIDETTDIVLVAHVGPDELGFPAETAKVGGKSLAFGLPAPGHHHTGSRHGEFYGGGATDAGQGAGDQNDGVGHGFLLLGPSHLPGMSRRVPERHVQRRERMPFRLSGGRSQWGEARWPRP
jgi:hypothetical protein